MKKERVNIISGTKDERCNAIVIKPMKYLSKKWNIPIDVDQNPAKYKINLYYREVSGVKPADGNLHGIYIDDLPHRYSLSNEFYIGSYDFYVVSNYRMKEYLTATYGEKPTIYFEGLCGKEYYRDFGCLMPPKKGWKKVAMFINNAYHFPYHLFFHKGWEMVYFSNEKEHKGGKKLPIEKNINSFFKKASEISPDIIIQSWLPNDANFFYKAKVKLRDSITLSSCLVAQDLGNIYKIENGKNGFVFKSIEDFHKLLDKTSVNKFRKIGKSHKDLDKTVLAKLYLDLIQVEEKLRWCKTSW